MILLFLLAFTSISHATQITVFGDVHRDVEFFTKTFPWIIDNIGGYLTVEYFMLGSGRYSVPQMCALRELKTNTFLQAQYLKCEAEGNPSEYCLCDAGIDPKKFKQCVVSSGFLTSLALSKYSELGIETTPIITLQPNNCPIYSVEDIWYLKKICSLFDEFDVVPRACHRVSQNLYESFPDKRAVAQFDKVCHKEFPISCGDNQPVNTPWPEIHTTEGFETTSW